MQTMMQHKQEKLGHFSLPQHQHHRHRHNKILPSKMAASLLLILYCIIGSTVVVVHHPSSGLTAAAFTIDATNHNKRVVSTVLQPQLSFAALRTTTRLHYKHKENEDDDTPADVTPSSNIQNNGNDTPENTNNNNKASSSSSELLKAIEPIKDKPTRKWMSPIQLIKRVPKVTPVNMTSVFFVNTMTVQPPPPTSSVTDNTNSGNSISGTNNSPPPTTTTWKDQMRSQQRRPTAFQATNYLESLGGGGSIDNTAGNSSPTSSSSSNSNDDHISTASNQQNQQQQQEESENTMKQNNDNDLYKNLKAQQGNLRNEQRKSMQEAFYNAMRRTNPKDVIKARYENMEKERKAKERERLEREYVERKERLDARKREEDEVVGQDGDDIGQEGQKKKASKATSRRGLPILGPFIQSPSPLLIGSTRTFQYSELNAFQKKALEVSRHYHEEHCTRMKEEEEEAEKNNRGEGGGEGGIQAAPIVAIIDKFTGQYEGGLMSSSISEDDKKRNKRFATLASVTIEPNQDGTEPAVVMLTGIGRVFLYDYFSSNDAGITKEEEELENILKLIQEIDDNGEEQGENDDDDEDGKEEEEDLPVVMASFDVILDDSSIKMNQSTKHQEATEHRASSMHAITELYRTANKVYRLHEDRKKIVAGLKAAEARLLLGKERMFENCDTEYEDCDGLGSLFSLDEVDMSSEIMDDDEGVKEEQLPQFYSCPLAKVENYGFGSYGILSTIPDLTKELMLYLESYYSPSHREREEYFAEIASFVAWRCLEKYADPSDIAKALLTPSATERLNLAYYIMMRHRGELNGLVSMISDDLFECGDDCKDLW